MSIVTIPLDKANNFALCPDVICKALSADSSIKVVFITTLGNPTGNLIAKSDIEHVLKHPTWSGYVEFCAVSTRRKGDNTEETYT